MASFGFTFAHYAAVILILIQYGQYASCGVNKRTVQTFPMPDCKLYKSCNDSNEAPNIVYVKSSAENNDILHFVFSTLEVPTVMIVHTTEKDATLKFNWDNLAKSVVGGITVDGKPTIGYSFAVAFTKLIEYNDFSDDADLVEYAKGKKQQWNTRPFDSSMWQRLVQDVNDHNAFTFTTYNYTTENETNSGNMSFAFRVPDSNGRDSVLPSLKYVSNETLFDFILANYTPSFENSRFAVEIVAISKMPAKKMSIVESKSIDDEHSPGVFRIVNWHMDPAHSSGTGYLQWKPVCYLDEGRGRKSESKVKNYDVEDFASRPKDKERVKNSIMYGLFGDTLFSDKTFLIKTSNISFGLGKDGYYTGTNYTVWTAAIGYGNPPEDGISLTVIIVIACGLGLPVLIIMIGIVFLAVRKLRTTQTYSPLNTQVN